MIDTAFFFPSSHGARRMGSRRVYIILERSVVEYSEIDDAVSLAFLSWTLCVFVGTEGAREGRGCVLAVEERKGELK